MMLDHTSSARVESRPARKAHPRHNARRRFADADCTIRRERDRARATTARRAATVHHCRRQRARDVANVLACSCDQRNDAGKRLSHSVQTHEYKTSRWRDAIALCLRARPHALRKLFVSNPIVRYGARSVQNAKKAPRFQGAFIEPYCKTKMPQEYRFLSARETLTRLSALAPGCVSYPCSICSQVTQPMRLSTYSCCSFASSSVRSIS